MRSIVWGAGNSAPRDEFVAEHFRSLKDGKPPEVGASERVVKAYLNKQRDDPLEVLKNRAECPRCYHQENTKSTTFAGMSRCIQCWSPITNYMWRWEPLPMLPLPHGLGSSSAVSDSTGSKSRRRDGDGDTSGAAVPKQRNIASVQATSAGPADTGVAAAAAMVAALIIDSSAAAQVSEPVAVVQVQTAAKSRKDQREAEQRALREARESAQAQPVARRQVQCFERKQKATTT